MLKNVNDYMTGKGFFWFVLIMDYFFGVYHHNNIGAFT